ncbi:MAG TPA: cell division protein ZapA [Bacteriovoracaceae bacterium]|nr:cell division protein ZapA [Bacteriovoracaceae bacterium]
MSQEVEFNVLGCKVKVRPDQDESHNAMAVVNLVNAEIQQLKISRPMLRDTDVAVLVALKIATEKMQIEEEYKTNLIKLETSLEQALRAFEAN